MRKKAYRNILKVITTIILLLVVSLALFTARELFHTNKGESISHGTRSNGSLENGWLIPYSGNNYKSFSIFSYYFMDNAYVNDKVCRAIEGAYKACDISTPEVFYRYMECSDHDGGRLNFHKSHRNGLSVDFMVPKVRNDMPYTSIDSWGLAHYFLEFDNTGTLLQDYPILPSSIPPYQN